ncbi:MAG: hypothetical protein HYZ81_23485 [Nitrospinae bacterium]|nr:hypothetical protein [Nitrospinota bacterium]
MRNHTPTSCRLCDCVAAENYRRHWKHKASVGAWHLIIDGPDLMARLPRQAHYVTVLAYWVGDDGTPAQYQGPLYWEYDSTDHAHALADVRRCIELLQTEYDCPLEAVHVWHSGGRGFHVTIPPVVIGSDAGHPQLPRIYAGMIQRLFPPIIATSLDRGIYNMGMGRMWRLPNRRRSDNGQFKVALTMREVLHKPYGELEALTMRPRKGLFWPADDELSPCPGLVQLYRETAAAVEQVDQPQPLHPRTWEGSGGAVDLLVARCAFIRHGQNHAATLSEPEWYAMVSNMARCTNGPAAVHELSAPYPRYTVQETDAKIAHALKDTGPHTCAFIQARGFQGCPPWGCGVKAPVILARCDPRQAGPGGLRTVPAAEVKTWHS